MQSTPATRDDTSTSADTKVPPGDDAGEGTATASELERTIAETIQENSVVQWMRSHPSLYQGIAPGATLLVAILIYVALRAVFFLPLMRFLERREQRALAREGSGSSKHRPTLPLVRAVRETKLINALAWILPLLIAWRGIHLWPELLPAVAESFGRVMLSIAIVFVLLAGARVLLGVDMIVSERLRRPGALRGYVQAVTAMIGVVGGVTIISLLLGRSPLFFLTGVGAFAALLAVVLKDTLLSMYANILMTTGDTLRVGDWIEMRQHGLDGRVEQIRLTSTKVRNWDETTLSVPNYRFVSEIFVNYRTQDPKGGRRMKRSMRLDQRTVRELTVAEMDAARGVAELAQPAAVAQAAAVLASGGTRAIVTNLALYRAYLERFLAAHPLVDRSRPVVVRQNEPSATGVLLDVLCFYRDSDLKDYETLQSGMLDHFAAVASAFGLRVYQQGSDLGVLREPLEFLASHDRRLLVTPEGREASAGGSTSA